jgi:uncharacterized damage-inducible protein DinB
MEASMNHSEIDPGEVQAWRLEKVGMQLDALLHQPEVADRAWTQPGDDEWSVLQILGHMAEMIPYWMDHCRRMIAATGEPPAFGRRLDAAERLAGVELGASARLDELLPLVQNEIQVAARAIREMSPAERARKGIHLRDGEMTVAEAIERIIVEHAEEHLAQIEATLSTGLSDPAL